MYVYEAADRSGKKVSARIEASDPEQVKLQLREQGLMPLNIKVASARRNLFAGRLTRKDLLVFTQELGNLLESGLPVDRAIFVLAEHSEKDAMRGVLQDVYKDLQRGQSLSQAMGRHRVFPKLYINMIHAGEIGGTMDEVIKRLAGFLDTTVQFQEEVATAMIYPALLTLVGGVSVIFIMTFVVPRFAQMFKDMGQGLPTPTLVLMSISSFFASYWWLLLGGLAAAIIVLRSYASTTEGRLFVDNLKLNIPLIRRVHMQLVIARFARTLGTLLKSGVPVLEAIRISRGVIGNEILSEKLAALEVGVEKGRGVAGPLKEARVFPSIVGQIIGVGEEAGRLEEAFLNVAARFESESTNMIKRTVNMIAPAIILFMALIVGFIVISMLLAVFSINEIPV
jgi:general secretion pathway protein F